MVLESRDLTAVALSCSALDLEQLCWSQWSYSRIVPVAEIKSAARWIRICVFQEEESVKGSKEETKEECEHSASHSLKCCVFYKGVT